MALESGSVGSVAGCVRMNRAARARADAIAVRCPLLAHPPPLPLVSVSVALHCIAVRIPIVLSSIRTPPFDRLSPSFERRLSRLRSSSPHRLLRPRL